jgi:hypothetical protein
MSHRMAKRTAMTSAMIEPVETFLLPRRLLVRVVGWNRLRVSVAVLTWPPAL